MSNYGFIKSETVVLFVHKFKLTIPLIELLIVPVEEMRLAKVSPIKCGASRVTEIDCSLVTKYYSKPNLKSSASRVCKRVRVVLIISGLMLFGATTGLVRSPSV